MKAQTQTRIKLKRKKKLLNVTTKLFSLIDLKRSTVYLKKNYQGFTLKNKIIFAKI